MTDPRAVPAPAWCKTSAWDPARVVRASRTRAMFVCRVLVAPLTQKHTYCTHKYALIYTRFASRQTDQQMDNARSWPGLKSARAAVT
eukprot:379355-Prymnesium_polylepis.1